MSKTESAMKALGTLAPNFSLLDIPTQQPVSLKEAMGSRATVIVFMCNHCPYVQHILPELPQVAQDFLPLGVRFIAINANDAQQYPEDAPEHMRILARDYDFRFPYLFDETQEVAKAYGAQCTPDFFVYDDALHLVYRGQFDDSRPGNKYPVNGASLRQALTCITQQQPIPEPQKPSIGCNIKWKSLG